MDDIICHISKNRIDALKAYKADLLSEPFFQLIKVDYPDFNRDCYISLTKLNEYRKKYIKNLIQDEIGEFDKLESQVADAITNNKLLSENIEDEIDERLTIGQRFADGIAKFGGSWFFIFLFFTFIFIWMGVNIWLLTIRPFDPYPFILLNLILSCLAAIQAPIIIMSQNRQEQKDRQRGEHDYKINLKAELEIKLLHEKIDHLLLHQNKRILEIQQLTTDYLEDISNQLKKQKGK